jgi:hypothetical protein
MKIIKHKKENKEEEEKFNKEFIVVCSKQVGRIYYESVLDSVYGRENIRYAEELFFTTMTREEIEDFIRTYGEKNVVYISKNEKCTVESFIYMKDKNGNYLKEGFNEN